MIRLHALVLLTCFTLGAGEPPDTVWRGGVSPTWSGGSSLPLASWNIERGLRSDDVAGVLQQRAPAVALLQEVDMNAARTGRRNIAEVLASKLGLAYLFAAEFVELGQGKSDAPAYHGQAILTALPALNARIIRFRDQTEYWRPRWFLPNWGVFQRRSGGRLTLVAEIPVAAERLVLYNVHLESRDSEDLRLRQIEEIISDASRYPPETPILLAGDLNTRKADPPAVGALLRAGFLKALGGEVTTIHGTRLDWIFVRGAISFSDGAIHKDVRASDHFPLTIRLAIDSSRRRASLTGKGYLDADD